MAVKRRWSAAKWRWSAGAPDLRDRVDRVGVGLGGQRRLDGRKTAGAIAAVPAQRTAHSGTGVRGFEPAAIGLLCEIDCEIETETKIGIRTRNPRSELRSELRSGLRSELRSLRERSTTPLQLLTALHNLESRATET